MVKPRITIAAIAVLLAAGALVWWSESTQPTPETATDDRTAADAATATAPEQGTRAATPGELQRDQAPAEVSADDTAANATQSSPKMRVRVVDPDNAPIPHATVQSFADSTPATVATGPDGWCELPIAVAAGAIRLRITAGTSHRQANWERREELTIRLPWAGPLHGRVVDQATGAPIAGAALRLPHSSCKRCEPDLATSAADGSFVIPSVPRNQANSLVVTAIGFANQYFRFELPGRGDPVEYTFELQRGQPISGRCVDHETRRPIGGANLVLEGSTIATTAADGAFHALVLPTPDGTSTPQVQADGYLWTTLTIDAPPLDESREFGIPRSSAFCGTVRNERGHPVVRAFVHAYRDHIADATTNASLEYAMPDGVHLSEHGHFPRGITDEHGRYRVSGMIPGAAYRLTVRHPEYEMATPKRRGLAVQAEPENVTAHLTVRHLGPMGTIFGRYRRNGKPVGGSLHWRGRTRRGTGRIDRNGWFEVDRVEAGDVEIKVIAEEFRSVRGPAAEAVTARRELHLEPEAKVELVLDHVLEMATVRGTVRYPDGEPVAGRFLLASDRSIRARARTDANGRYTIELPPAFDGEVRISAGDNVEPIHTRPGTTAVDFTVPRPGTIRLTARAADDDAVVTARWMYRRRGSEHFRRVFPSRALDPEGALTLELARGDYEFMATAKRFGIALATATIGSESPEIAVRLARTRAVRFRIPDDATWPKAPFAAELVPTLLDDARIEGHALAPGWNPRTVTPDVRDAPPVQLAPGRYRIRPNSTDIVIRPQYVDIGPALPEVITLRWEWAR